MTTWASRARSRRRARCWPRRAATMWQQHGRGQLRQPDDGSQGTPHETSGLARRPSSRALRDIAPDVRLLTTRSGDWRRSRSGRAQKLADLGVKQGRRLDVADGSEAWDECRSRTRDAGVQLIGEGTRRPFVPLAVHQAVHQEGRHRDGRRTSHRSAAGEGLHHRPDASVRVSPITASSSSVNTCSTRLVKASHASSALLAVICGT